MSDIHRKYQIFISSTYIDLIEERQKLIYAIHKMEHIPVGMEFFNPSDKTQWDLITKTIDESDYYILLVGNRYGSMVDDEDVSYTEKEYRYAKSKEIPVIPFIINDKVPINPEFLEDDYKRKKLNEFKATVSKEYFKGSWKNTDQLATNVVISLEKIFREVKRSGWIRVTEEIEKVLTDKDYKEYYSSKKRTPDLEVEFEGIKSKEIIINIKDLKHNLELKLKNKYSVLPVIVPEPLKNYLTDKEIIEFNNKIPEINKTIEIYNKNILRYICVENGLIQKFRIINHGDREVHDIHVEISFDDNFVIEYDDIKDNLEKPKDDIPKSPIEIAEIMKNNDNKLRAAIANRASFGHICATNSNSVLAQPVITVLKPFDINKIVNRKIIIDGNTIYINIDRLLHTLSSNWYDFIFCPPLIPGIYSIDVYIICEELAHPIEYLMKVKVINQ